MLLVRSAANQRLCSAILSQGDLDGAGLGQSDPTPGGEFFGEALREWSARAGATKVELRSGGRT